MASSVFFKFKSQKEPTRVEFDGTGITVFELKRDIVIKSGLGDGTDFDLAIYSEDGREAYDDDTAVIPRSTTVVARRLPASKPGAGRAARYVSGRAPVTAKNNGRREPAVKAVAKAVSSASAQMQTAITEEEKMAAMFQAQDEQWTAQQEEMSHHAPIYKPGAKKAVNVPEHEPPAGYICYRCNQKGHWIQQCPTNDDPEFDNKPRVKRTTGIPRSFLKTVDKETALAQAAADDADPNARAGLMVNADGDFVIVETDKATWQQFQAKNTAAAAKKEVDVKVQQQLQDRGLECPIDHKMFIEPVKTPCCKKTYCNECITNALIEGDLICPSCETEGVLIDDLKPDVEKIATIAAYLEETSADTKAKEGSKSPPAVKSEEGSQPAQRLEASQDQVKKERSKSPDLATLAAVLPVKFETTRELSPPTKTASPIASEAQAVTKKRAAPEAVEQPAVKIPKGPKAEQAKHNQPQQQFPQNGNMMGMMNPMNDMSGFQMPMGMIPNMMMPMGGFPNMNNMMGFPNMMNPMLANPMMMGGFNGMMNGNSFGNGMNGMVGMNGMNGMNGNYNNNVGGYNTGNNNNNNNNMNYSNKPPTGPSGNHNNLQIRKQVHGPNQVNNQNTISSVANEPGYKQMNFTQPNGDEEAYFRKPVNPHRHQNRQKRQRPSDYREL